MNESMDASGLLRSAAKLIDRALLKLDMRKSPCKECGDERYVNFEHARLYQQFTDTPYKLERAAALLAGEPEALAGRQGRAVLDQQTKKAVR